MARHKRIQTPGLLRHVVARGNGRKRIFIGDRDYRKFLFVLGDVVEEFDIECWDYCVMPNHYHLALWPRRANLSAAIQRLNGTFGTWWNPAHSTVGHVFQGRFKDQIVQREGYLAALCRYIALNPVRAKLVDAPADWLWSGYAAIAGQRPNPGFLFSDPIINQFGDINGDIRVLRGLYKRHILKSMTEDDKEERLRSKERVLGEAAFKREVRNSAKPQTGSDQTEVLDRAPRTFMAR